MTYQTAYKLLVAAYKSAKGVMPQGIDMLKLKMKARQKVIDAKKVIEFPKDKITNPFKPRPTKTEIMMKQEGIPVTIKGKTTTMTPDGILKMLMGKGKGKDVKIGQAPKTTKRKPTVDPKLTQEENIKRIMAENKAAAKRLQEKMNKPEKTLGEKLKDYDGDPDGMAGGGKVKKPFRSKVVDFLGGPSVVGAELGLSGLLEVYNILGMPLMKDGGKVKKKRKHDDNIDEEDIGEGKSKERFLRVMPEVDGISRSDGIIELATGGMTNIGDTYDNNPTLQSQYPNKQDYLDLFAQQTTTTPQYATAYQSTGSTDPINPNIKQIKPIIKIPQDSGGDGGGGGITNTNYGYTSPYAQSNTVQGPMTKDQFESFLTDIGEGTIEADKEKSGLMNLLSLSPTLKTLGFIKNKAVAGKKQLDDYFAKKAEEKALKEMAAKVAAARAANVGGSYSGGQDFADNNPYGGDGTMNDLGADNFT